MNLYDWQQPNAAAMRKALIDYKVVADASETGTGKTFKALATAKALGYCVVVVCPKAVVPEWKRVGELWGVQVDAVNYERVRMGKTPLGLWAVKNAVFKWTLQNNTLLIFDEAHNCGGLKTKNAKMLIAAKRQRIPLALLSATLIANPLKCYAIGYALGLHGLTNYWAWASTKGVAKGFFGMEWNVSKEYAVEIMESIREEIGPRFVRIRKSDVPGFPQNQIIPQLVDSIEMPELVGDYSIAARQLVEAEKVVPMSELAEGLVEQGYSVVLFVNFIATLEALQKRFPNAALIRGGQSAGERATAITSFQQNEKEILLVMSQAGGTGLSLHDLNGRPRAAIISPGWSATEFLQVLGRIHRAGSLSPAINYIIFASGVPVERRIRSKLESKLNNLTALNDHDLESPLSNAGGAAPAAHGTPQNPIAAHTNGGEVNQAQHAGVASGAGEHHVHSNGAGCGGSQLMSAVSAAPEAQATLINTEAATGNHVVRKHAPASPSKLKNLEICPSYEPDNSGPVHPVTLRGTAMHEALETGDDSKLDPEGKSTEERDLVATVRGYIEEEKVVYGIVEVVDEMHLKTHDRDVAGFVDRVMFGPRKPNKMRTSYVRDYKMGFNLVDSPSINPQAIAYVLGIFLKHDDVDEVNFAFMIPRCDAILEHTFTRADIPWMKVRISTIAERRRKLAGKEFNPNNDNCLYCGRKATCVALHQKALVIANGYNEDEKLALPTEFHSSLISDPVQMAKALNVATVMEKWVGSVRAHALALRLELGVEIPGYQLIERQGKRVVQNTAQAWEIAQTFGVTQEEFMAAADVSIPMLEEAVKAKVAKGKAKKIEEFNDALIDASAVTRGNSFHVLQKERKKSAAKEGVAA
jgi:hypothetical protein